MTIATVRRQQTLDFSHDFSHVEDYRHGLGLNFLQAQHTELMAKTKIFQEGRKARQFTVGGAVLRPVSAQYQVSRSSNSKADDFHPAERFKLVMLLPFPNCWCPLATRTRRTHRLQLCELSFGLGEDGCPRFRAQGRDTSVDFAKSPYQRSSWFETVVYDPASVGGMMEAVTEAGDHPLLAPIAGELRAEESSLWLELVIRSKKYGRDFDTTILRFRRQDADRILLPQIDSPVVAAGTPVAILLPANGKVEYGRAILRGANNLVKYGSKDVLSLTYSGLSANDFLCHLGLRAVEGMLAAEDGGEASLLASSIPPLMAHFNKPLDEWLADFAQDAWTSVALEELKIMLGYGKRHKLYIRAMMPDGVWATYLRRDAMSEGTFDVLHFSDDTRMDVPHSAEMIIEPGAAVKRGDPIANYLPRMQYTNLAEISQLAGGDIHDLRRAFFHNTTVQYGPEWRKDGFLIDRRLVPDSMLPAVKSWYWDFRRVHQMVDMHSGAVMLPAFPRDQDEFTWFVGGIDIDAEPAEEKYQRDRRD